MQFYFSLTTALLHRMENQRFGYVCFPSRVQVTELEFISRSPESNGKGIKKEDAGIKRKFWGTRHDVNNKHSYKHLEYFLVHNNCLHILLHLIL